MTSSCVIETSRLLLKPLCEEDLEAFHILQSDPLVTQFTKHGPNRDIVKSQEMLDDCLIKMNISDLAEPVLILAIFMKPVAHGSLKGLIGTFRPCELGFSLHPSLWGRGFAQEAVNAFCLWFKSKFPGKQLFAKVDSENHASMKVCQRCGFTPATNEEVANNLRLQLDGDRQSWLCRI